MKRGTCRFRGGALVALATLTLLSAVTDAAQSSASELSLSAAAGLTGQPDTASVYAFLARETQSLRERAAARPDEVRTASFILLPGYRPEDLWSIVPASARVSGVEYKVPTGRSNEVYTIAMGSVHLAHFSGTDRDRVLAAEKALKTDMLRAAGGMTPEDGAHERQIVAGDWRIFRIEVIARVEHLAAFASHKDIVGAVLVPEIVGRELELPSR